MTFWYKREFEKSCQRYSQDVQRLVATAIVEVKDWYRTRKAPVGLRIKKLYDGPTGKVLEARASLGLRLIWLEQEETVWFATVGSHDAVRRYIRSFRFG